MTEVGARGPRPSWLWPVVLVTALQLLTTAGTWWITDHGEILAVADHFLASGELNLADLGPGWEGWARIAAIRGSTETRFLPLSILPLVPFLILDHLFRFPPSAFRFVHLEGHVFVTLGLILSGRGLVKRGATPAVVALCIILLGLNWPVWMVARRLGPEPILFFLMTLFATGGRHAKLVALVLLPWVHASGSLLALGAFGWSCLEVRSLPSLPMKTALASLVGGFASVLILWNLPHGDAVLGSYGRYASDPFFVPQNPLLGSVKLAVPVVLWTLPLWLGALDRERRGRLSLLALWFPVVIFFGTFSTQEPERRLMPLLGVTLLSVAPLRVGVTRRTSGLLILYTVVSGALGLASDFVDVVPTPLGLFSGPVLGLLRLGMVDGHSVIAAIIVVTLLFVALVAGVRSIKMAVC
ncbi:MAG: hypothetical protein ABI672_10525 [Vicinamibacteria bacterium]